MDLERKRNQNPTICCPQDTYFCFEDTFKLKVKGWENTFHVIKTKEIRGGYPI
jgi:hypothetical protein